jgi:beta-lactamase class A
LVLGETLSAAGRQRLEGWLVKNTTGDKRLRAGLPSTWQIGDKTGTGENDKINAAFAAMGKLVGEEF